MKNYYDILHLSKEADAQQIRQAFRRLSKQYHPDRNGGSRSLEEKFKEINEAYQVLRDPVRRWQYKQDLQHRAYGSGHRNDPSSPPKGWRWRQARRPRSAPKKRQPFKGRSSGGFDAKGAFWSCLFGIVFVLPFMLAATTPDDLSAERQFASYEPPSYHQRTTDVRDRIDRRYERDVYYLNEIRKIDPGLRGLDMETGYYELRGKTVKLSWDILQLIREKQWKNR